MKYPAIVTKVDSSYLVEFPGLDGCFTEGKNLPEAILNGKEALDAWLESNYERNLAVKKPEECLKLAKKLLNSKQTLAKIPVSARLALAYQMRFSRLSDGRRSLQEVADLMHMTQQNYSKVFENPRANPTLETIEKGLGELGYFLEINILPKSEKPKVKIQNYTLTETRKKRA